MPSGEGLQDYRVLMPSGEGGLQEKAFSLLAARLQWGYPATCSESMFIAREGLWCSPMYRP